MTIFILHMELVCCRGRVRCRTGWLLLLGRELRQEVEKMVPCFLIESKPG